MFDPKMLRREVLAIAGHTNTRVQHTRQKNVHMHQTPRPQSLAGLVSRVLYKNYVKSTQHQINQRVLRCILHKHRQKTIQRNFFQNLGDKSASIDGRGMGFC